MPKGRMSAPMPGSGAKDLKKALISLALYCKKYWALIIIALCCAVLSAVLTVIGPDYISELTAVIQRGIGFTGVDIDLDEVARIGFILIAIYALSMVLHYCQSFIMNYAASNVGRAMRSDISKKIDRIPLKYFDSHNYGDTHEIARATSGASGAELANIVNEAALRAVRMGRSEVTQEDLMESVETVIAGAQRKNAVLSEEEKKIVSYHEIGHALVAAMQSHSAPVTKITIIPRTSGALGYTMQVDEGDRYLMNREELFNKITTLTGGRAAEQLVFGSVTTGAGNDIEKATKLARSMVTRYGMGEFGMVALETVNGQYLGQDASLACSPAYSEKIDDQVVALAAQARAKADRILKENEAKLHKLAAYLLQKETITGDEFMKVLNA